MKKADIIDYKKFYNRVKQTYPLVTSDLDPDPPVTDPKRLPEILDHFCTVTGFTSHQVADNKEKSLLLFIGVVAKLYSPNIHRFDERYPYSLSMRISKILQVKKARILYYDRICRSYLQIYPEFSKAVDDIYQAIVDSLQKKSLVQLPGLMNKGICIK